LYWAANSVARYAVQHIEAWSKLPPEDQYDLLKKTPWTTRDRAGAKGTTIHAVADNILQGRDYPVEAIIEPWIHSLRRFLADAQPQSLGSEVTGYSEKTATAGTFDLLCRFKNAPEMGRVLLDWKTSAGVYDDMAVQVVGGYALNFEYTLDANDKEVEWQPPDTCLIVHLQQDGYHARPVPMDKIYRRAFLACLEIRRWEEEGPKIGDPYTFQREGETPFNQVPTNAELAHLRARLELLDTDQRLELMTEVDAAGITTNIKTMTVDDVDRVLGFMARYQITEETSARIKGRTPSRPMP
jgi:hypothetical protein